MFLPSFQNCDEKQAWVFAAAVPVGWNLDVGEAREGEGGPALAAEAIKSGGASAVGTVVSLAHLSAIVSKLSFYVPDGEVKQTRVFALAKFDYVSKIF